MFISADAFNQPLNAKDVSNVTDMSYMFKNTIIFNQPLNDWDVSNVTDMEVCLLSCLDQDISTWSVSPSTTLSSTTLSTMLYDMFQGSPAANDYSQPVSYADFNRNADETFRFTDANLSHTVNEYIDDNNFSSQVGNIEGWNVSLVTNMSGLSVGKSLSLMIL